ncbi:IclR family transcriptional regulator [Pseudalkalibacillus sp. A8]|uniref:IclR family transcriptional regulator n=1 Tax=Pseudalkalibacillus sp. A8 TaxID=3382641 RepID=UPI0038B6610C
MILTLCCILVGKGVIDIRNPKSSIKSIEIGFLILRAFVNEREPLSLSHLSQATGLYKSQLYRYLNSFVKKLGVIVRNDGDIPRWSLGPELIALGEAAFTSLNVAIEAKPELIKLRNRLNETVALSIWRDKGPFFLRWEKSNKLVNIGLDTGSYISLYSATGKIFRAFLPEEKTAHLYKQEVNDGNIEPDTYLQDIKQIKQNGISITESSLLSGISAISAPIFSSSNELAGALSIVGVQGVLDVSPDSTNARALKEITYFISEKLGYQRTNKQIQR